MQFTILALPTLFLGAALAAPSPILDNTSVTNNVEAELESAIPSLPVNSAIPSLPIEKREEDLVPTSALSKTDVSSVTEVVDELESSVPESDGLIGEKRQTEPIVDLLDELLGTISPIAGEIEDALASITGDEAVEALTDIQEEVEGLLTQLVIEIESVAGNLTDVATGGKARDIADILKPVLALVDIVIEDVQEKLGVDALDSVISELNHALNGLIDTLDGLVDGLFDELNETLSGLELKGLDVPAIGGLLH